MKTYTLTIFGVRIFTFRIEEVEEATPPAPWRGDVTTYPIGFAPPDPDPIEDVSPSRHVEFL